MSRLLRGLLGLAMAALALVGIYLFTLGGTYVYVGIGLYVLTWLVWLFRPRPKR